MTEMIERVARAMVGGAQACWGRMIDEALK